MGGSFRSLPQTQSSPGSIPGFGIGPGIDPDCGIGLCQGVGFRRTAQRPSTCRCPRGSKKRASPIGPASSLHFPSCTSRW
jgi:hypothetical protein